MKRNITKKLLAGLLISSVLFSSEVEATQFNTKGYYTIDIKGPVGEEMLAFVKYQMDNAYKVKAQRILFVINSPGGRVDSMNEIEHLMDTSSIPVDTYNIGMAASAAADILMHGKRRYVNAGAFTLLHYGSIRTEIGLGSQEGENLRKMFEASNRSAAIKVALLTGKTLEFVQKHLMIPFVDVSLSSAETVNMGVADELVITMPTITHVPAGRK
jgi:ATP-dependent protease ClpP protease subunit